jgi:hypothetical protein
MVRGDSTNSSKFSVVGLEDDDDEEVEVGF